MHEEKLKASPMKIKHAMSNLVAVTSHSELMLALGYIPKLHGCRK